MKSKLTRSSYCSRCGDEIAADELPFLQRTTLCAFCCNTHLECLEIYDAGIKKPKPVLTLVLRSANIHGITSV